MDKANRLSADFLSFCLLLIFTTTAYSLHFLVRSFFKEVAYFRWEKIDFVEDKASYKLEVDRDKD